MNVTDTFRHYDVCTMVTVLVACIGLYLHGDNTEVPLAILLIFYFISASFADLIDGPVEKTTFR